MIEFRKVRTGRLQAVTHVDGSARVKTVSRAQNPEIYELLLAFERLRYVRERGIEIAAVNGTLYDVARHQERKPNPVGSVGV